MVKINELDIYKSYLYNLLQHEKQTLPQSSMCAWDIDFSSDWIVALFQQRGIFFIFYFIPTNAPLYRDKRFNWWKESLDSYNELSCLNIRVWEP